MKEFKIGDKVKCINDDDLLPFPGGSVPRKGRIYDVLTVSDDFINGWFAYRFEPVELVEEKEAKMSKYQELKERIENVKGWNKEADDILGELKLTINWTICCQDDGTGFLTIYKTKGRGENPATRDWSKEIKFDNQCSKLTAFKQALLWLLDHSDIKKDNKQADIEKLKDDVARIEKQIVDVEMIKKRIKDLEIE